MFFFIIHHFMQAISPGMADVKRNCLTLLFGFVLYVITYGLMREYPLYGIFKIVADWWWYIAAVDAVAMAIIYRSYYGRSIIHEVTAEDTPAEGRWDYDEEQHQYRRSNLANKEAFFDGKLKTVDKIEKTLDQAEETLEDIHGVTDKVGQLEENLENLQTAFLCRPEGEFVQKMAEEFFEEEEVKQKSAQSHDKQVKQPPVEPKTRIKTPTKPLDDDLEPSFSQQEEV